jgi:hypothetical protein
MEARDMDKNVNLWWFSDDELTTLEEALNQNLYHMSRESNADEHEQEVLKIENLIAKLN